MAQHNEDMSTVSKWGDPIPAGSYHVRIDKVEERTSDTGNPVVRLHLKVQEEPHVGRVIVDDVSLQPHALAKLKAYYEAIDYNPGPEGHDPENLKGKELYVYTEQDVYQGTARNKVPPYGPRHMMKGKHPSNSASASAAAR